MDKGEKGTNLAQEFGISKQQISDIWKNKDKILKFTDSIKTSEGLKQKSLKLADDEQLDEALYAWFIQQRSTGTPISAPLLQEIAKHFSTQLNTETADREFKASTGWLSHIFDYPDSRLSGLFTKVPTSPDKRGSTVIHFGFCRILVPNTIDHGFWPNCHPSNIHSGFFA